MTWIIVIILIVLVIIAGQLIHSNKLKEHNLELQKKDKEEAEIDDILKYKYPHLFYDMKDELRSHYYALQEHSKDFERALKYHLDTRDDIVVSSAQIMHKIGKVIKDNKKLKDRMLEIAKYSGNFFENLSKERDITENEKSFISFLVWDRIDEYVTEPEKILELDMDTIKWWHEEYEDFFSKK